MKIRLFAILIVSLFIFAACTSATPARGIWEGNAFRNSYFGIRFDLPEGWHGMTTVGILEMYADMGYLLPPMGGQIASHEMYELAETIGIIDLAAERDDGMRSVATRIMRIPDEEPRMTATAFLQDIADDFEDVTVHDRTIRIGSLNWHYAQLTVEEGMAYQWYFVNMDGRFVRGIIVQHIGDSDFHETLEMFKAY